MKTNIIDNSKFPLRRVTVCRVTNPGPANLAYMMTLECGHKVGLKKDVAVPARVPCQECYKAGKP